MPSHTLPADYAECLSSGAATVADPGNAGTIQYNLKGFAQCFLTVDGSNETRSLETLTASNYPMGDELAVHLRTTTGGNVAISGSADGTVTLSTAGDFVIFRVAPTSTTANAWRIVYSQAGGSVFRGVETVTKSTMTTSAVVSATKLLTKWVEGTPDAATDAAYQLPTVASLVSTLPGARAGDSFIVVFNNVATDGAKISITTNTGWTLVGSMLIPSGGSRAFRIVLTSTSAATIMALGPNRDLLFQTSVSGAGALTVAQILSGAIEFTGTTYTVTLPSGAAVIPAIPNCKNGDTFDIVFNNNASGTITVNATGDGSNLIEGTNTIATTLCRFMRCVVVNASTTAYVAYMCT